MAPPRGVTSNAEIHCPFSGLQISIAEAVHNQFKYRCSVNFGAYRIDDFIH